MSLRAEKNILTIASSINISLLTERSTTNGRYGNFITPTFTLPYTQNPHPHLRKRPDNSLIAPAL